MLLTFSWDLFSFYFVILKGYWGVGRVADWDGLTIWELIWREETYRLRRKRSSCNCMLLWATGKCIIRAAFSFISYFNFLVPPSCFLFIALPFYFSFTSSPDSFGISLHKCSVSKLVGKELEWWPLNNNIFLTLKLLSRKRKKRKKSFFGEIVICYPCDIHFKGKVNLNKTSNIFDYDTQATEKNGRACLGVVN